MALTKPQIRQGTPTAHFGSTLETATLGLCTEAVDNRIVTNPTAKTVSLTGWIGYKLVK